MFIISTKGLLVIVIVLLLIVSKYSKTRNKFVTKIESKKSLKEKKPLREKIEVLQKRK